MKKNGKKTKKRVFLKVIAATLCAVVLGFGFLVAAVGLSVRTAGKDETVYANEYEKDYARAAAIYDTYYRNYFFKGFNKLTYYQGRGKAFCWEYIGLISLTYKMALLNPDYLADMDDILDGLLYYRTEKDGKFTGYAAMRSEFKLRADYKDMSYDDNMWLGRDFAAFYELTGDKKYLDLAVEIAEFIIADSYVDLNPQIFTDFGFEIDGNDIGGFYWGYKKEAIHTCSTGPAAQFLAAMYRLTNNEKYLETAVKTFNFVTYMTNGDGVFYDLMRFHKDAENNILAIKELDPQFYTYNSGSPITAAAELYKITSEKKYLDYASKWAEDADKYFARDTDKGVKSYPSMSWFNLILLNGYIALYEYDGAAAAYMDNMQKSIDYAYDNYRLKGFLGFNTNLIPGDWVGGWGNEGLYNQNALHMSSNAEIYATLALFHKRII
jgi:hypothetical protein